MRSSLVRNIRKLLLFVLLSSAIILAFGSNFYADWLWFRSIGYESVFLTMLLSDWGVKLIIVFSLFVTFFINLLFTRKMIPAFNYEELSNDNFIPLKRFIFERIITPTRLVIFYAAISLGLALFFSTFTTRHWLVVQRFIHRLNFNVLDPLFQKDISFFVFTLPFFQFLYSVLLLAVVGSGMLVASFYFLYNPTLLVRWKRSSFRQPQIHLSLLVALFFVLKSWGYRLQAYDLVRSPRGVAFGASYTDVHAQLPAYNILSVIALGCALLILISLFVRIKKLVVAGIGILLLSSVLLGTFFPALVQKLQVTPNELEKEKEYLAYNIAYTRKAYGLEKIERKQFPANVNLSLEDLEKNQATLQNIRLWDWRPLKQTYNQIQGLRPYYDFKNVDVDRYFINGSYRQVMLAARELNQALLPEQAKRWVNQRLQYTHGYGVVMSPVNEVTPQGLPSFLIKDIPPKTVEGLPLKSPQIYFGELTNEYVVVNSKAQEFDYPSGEDNVDTVYAGKAGVRLSSLLHKAIFAIKFGDYKLLLSGDITPQSRILYNRNIMQMVKKVAPFLQFSQDPYIVLSGGKLYWMIDGFTISDMYPYSEPFQGSINYIRNSVKVVIDAYHGTIDFYISQADDPLVQSYAQIFPKLFHPLDEMPEDLRNHIRYPVDLFLVQAKMLNRYHVTNPRVFYNNEDNWVTPKEIYQGESQDMSPYYTIMQLPGEEKPEMVLMLPFTPARKMNMVAWLAARNDGEHYGELQLFMFPKDKHVYGPMQIEARIDQDSEISQQLTLWDQRGSQVLRGNLMVIPIEESILYIKPIFLQAEQSKLPELRRVIVIYGEKVVMGETLSKALLEVFGRGLEPVSPPDQAPAKTDLQELSLEDLINEANRLFNEASAAQRQGNWALYGQLLERLEATLKQMQSLY